MSESKRRHEAPFFVGYLNSIPKPLATFLLVFAVCFSAGMGVAAFGLSSVQPDPGDGAFRWGNRFEQTGYLEMRPYPVFRVAGENGEPDRTYMVSGQGKRGVFRQAEKYKDQAVTLRGVPLQRGDLTMVQVGRVRPSEDGAVAMSSNEATSLGKWRLTGEICDGKCYAGAMRPGRGLAHKACADFCLTGGVPPVFVSSGDVSGRNFFLLTDKNGELLGEELKDLLALYIEVEGEVEQLDDLLVFKADLDTVRIIR